MSDVTFAVLDVAPEPYAVTPILMARVGIAADGDDPMHAIALRCQVRIDPMRRGYSDDEAAEPVGPVRPTRALGHHAAHVPVAAHHRDGAGIHRHHSGASAPRVHL